MIIDRLWLTDFRNHRSTELRLDHQVSLITGRNGHGKTNLLEAIALLSGARSFRGASADALVMAGAAAAVVRAEVVRDDRTSLVEMQLAPGKTRAQVNRQAVRRLRDLSDVVRVVVFGPDDLDLVKGAPAGRRTVIDDVLSDIDVRFRQDRIDLDRILRQRNNLLRQAKGRLNPDVASTLDVWDSQLGVVGEAVTRARRQLLDDLGPLVEQFYTSVAGGTDHVALRYHCSWGTATLTAALSEGRVDELRRATTLVGPHRDDIVIELNGLPARTHASQGEQRSLALALRLAVHHRITSVMGDPPLVLLDDVFSELDDHRATRLIDCLPVAQIVLTSATGTVPPGIRPGLVVEVRNGEIGEVG